MSFFSVQGNAQHHIGRLGHVAEILLDLMVDGVHKDKGVDQLQGPVLPSGDLRHDLFADFTDQFWGDLHIVQS